MIKALILLAAVWLFTIFAQAIAAMMLLWLVNQFIYVDYSMVNVFVTWIFMMAMIRIISKYR